MEHHINMYQDFIRNFFKMNLYYKLIRILKTNLEIFRQKANILVVVHIIIWQIANLIKAGQMKAMDFRNIIIFILLLMHMMGRNVFVEKLKETYYCIHIHVNGRQNSIRQYSKVRIGLKYKTN